MISLDHVSDMTKNVKKFWLAKAVQMLDKIYTLNVRVFYCIECLLLIHLSCQVTVHCARKKGCYASGREISENISLSLDFNGTSEIQSESSNFIST